MGVMSSSLCEESYGLNAHIPDRVIVTVSDEMDPCSRVYVVGHAGFSVCQTLSFPDFGVAVLAMLIQKVEAPEGDGCSLGSLQGWFGGAALPVLQSDVKSMWWVTFGD
jgi:hypothetical protein